MASELWHRVNALERHREINTVRPVLVFYEGQQEFAEIENFGKTLSPEEREGVDTITITIVQPVTPEAQERFERLAAEKDAPPWLEDYPAPEAAPPPPPPEKKQPPVEPVRVPRKAITSPPLGERMEKLGF